MFLNTLTTDASRKSQNALHALLEGNIVGYCTYLRREVSVRWKSNDFDRIHCYCKIIRINIFCSIILSECVVLYKYQENNT